MRNFSSRISISIGALLVSLASFLTGCSTPNESPDQTIAGAALGAAWGAGAGAIVGNQVGNAGPGAAVGAGLGAASGAMAGYGFDRTESTGAKLQGELNALRMQNLTNANQLRAIQSKLDDSASNDYTGGMFQIYFDEDATNLRAGSVANLEAVADALRKSTHAFRIKVVGHSDDGGTPDYSQRVSEARARTVSSYIAARGISMDQIVVESYGSTRPIASNETPVGRQLNRRVDVFIVR